jgi:hypothetical protein
MSRPIPERCWICRQVKRIGRCRVVRQKAQRISCVERNCELLPVVVIRHRETAAENTLTILTEDKRSKSALEVGRPRNRDTRLEVVLVGVVHRRTVVFLTRKLDKKRFVVIAALFAAHSTAAGNTRRGRYSEPLQARSSHIPVSNIRSEDPLSELGSVEPSKSPEHRNHIRSVANSRTVGSLATGLPLASKLNRAVY